MYKKGNKSEKKTRGESYTVLKKKTNNNNNNKKKYVKNDNFEKKKKLQNQIISQLNIEEINSIKIIFKKNILGKFF